ncbi:MAG: Ppx/GppA phosphatase family protein [Mariprofundaceae bacterium]|nr:Ppx/GppA phosphatase family protein [Mariprofundaceae bacterium]
MEIQNLIAEDESLNRGALIAAIDVGSNAMRLGIAAFDTEAGIPQMIQRYREPVRLGHDAFTSGILSDPTMDDAVNAFHYFRKILDQHHIERYRATATSAMRDSKNSHVLIKRIYDETNIKLTLISGEEEGRLVQLSIARRVDLNKQFALLVDMGGGSVEVTLCDNGEVISAQSFKIGTVRLLEMLGQGGDINGLLSEYLEGTRNKLKQQIGKRRPALCIATGGNAGAIGSLAFQLLGTESVASIQQSELKVLIRKLASMNLEERIHDLDLRPDRADVILPASMVFHEIMNVARVQTMVMPDASLLDGILIGMMESEDVSMHSQRRNLLAWARSLKKKYHVDQSYAKSVARLALNLFDQTYAIHGLTKRERLVLEIACRAHEIGMYVRVGGHHRHAAYLISASPLLGISTTEKAVLGQTVRYQRKAVPSDEHQGFMQLNSEDKQSVWVLSCFLRLAIALNKDRRNRIHHVHVSIDEKDMRLQLQGDGNLLLERWAALKVSAYVEQVFALSLHIERG